MDLMCDDLSEAILSHLCSGCCTLQPPRSSGSSFLAELVPVQFSSNTKRRLYPDREFIFSDQDF